MGTAGRPQRADRALWRPGGLGYHLGPCAAAQLVSLRAGGCAVAAFQKRLRGKGLKQNVLWESRLNVKVCPLKQRCDGTGELQTPGVRSCRDQPSQVLRTKPVTGKHKIRLWKKSVLKCHGHVLGDACCWPRKCLGTRAPSVSARWVTIWALTEVIQ